MRRSLLAFVGVFLAVALSARADDTTPPLIKHTPVTHAYRGETVTISAGMYDQSEIFAPTLYFRYPGASTYSSIPMTKKSGHIYAATIEATADIEYWIEAYDEYGNGPTRDGTPDHPHKITVTDRPAPRPIAEAAPAPAPMPPPAPAPPPPPAPAPMVSAPTAESLPPPPPPPLPPAAEAPTVLPTPTATPIYKQWWFIGGGAVVVAAVVTGVVLAAQPSPIHQNVFSATLSHP